MNRYYRFWSCGWGEKKKVSFDRLRAFNFYEIKHNYFRRFFLPPPRRATPHVISKWKLIHSVSLKGSPSFLSFVSISFCAVLAFLLICPKYDLLRTVISEISLCSPVEINTVVRKKLFPSSFTMEIKMRDKRLKIDGEYFFTLVSMGETLI